MNQKNILAVTRIDYNEQAKLNALNKGTYGKTVNTVMMYFQAALQLAQYSVQIEEAEEGMTPDKFAQRLSESQFTVDGVAIAPDATIRVMHMDFGKVYHVWVRKDATVTVIYHLVDDFDDEKSFDLKVWRDGKSLGDLEAQNEEDRGNTLDWLGLAHLEGDNYEVVVPSNHPLATNTLPWPAPSTASRLSTEHGARGTAVPIVADSVDHSMLGIFYPLTMVADFSATSLWQANRTAEIKMLFDAARKNNHDAESRMIDIVGQLRRLAPDGSGFSQELYEAVLDICMWLELNDRTVDMFNEDPAKWISQRGGMPRWK